MQRIPIITPKLSQIILEVWNSGKKFQPIFSENWKNLQLVICKGSSYHGISGMGTNDRKVHIFRLNQRSAETTRFIWLSADRSDFWDNPISEKDIITDLATREIEVTLVS